MHMRKELRSASGSAQPIMARLLVASTVTMIMLHMHARLTDTTGQTGSLKAFSSARVRGSRVIMGAPVFTAAPDFMAGLSSGAVLMAAAVTGTSAVETSMVEAFKVAALVAGIFKPRASKAVALVEGTSMVKAFQVEALAVAAASKAEPLEAAVVSTAVAALTAAALTVEGTGKVQILADSAPAMIEHSKRPAARAVGRFLHSKRMRRSAEVKFTGNPTGSPCVKKIMIPVTEETL
jgi:hypothetical protein